MGIGTCSPEVALGVLAVLAGAPAPAITAAFALALRSLNAANRPDKTDKTRRHDRPVTAASSSQWNSVR